MDDEIVDPVRRPDPLFEGDQGTLTLGGRRALVLLLKHTHLALARHPEEWEALLCERERIHEILNEMFLVLVLDEQAGVAYKTQAEPEGNQVFNTLLNRRPLQVNELRVLLRLRELLREGAAAGQGVVTVRGAELLDHLAEHYPAHKGDHVAARKQDESSINKLAADDILVPSRGSSGDDVESIVYTISHVVESIVTPARAQAFAQALRDDLDIAAPIAQDEDATDADDLAPPDDDAPLDEQPSLLDDLTGDDEQPEGR